MSNETHNNLWEQYQQAANSARRQGNLPKASRILREAFREAEEYGEIEESLVSLAHDLAEIYLGQYRYLEAESMYRSVLEVREKLLGQTHDDVVDSLKKVAIVQILAFRSEALGSKVIHSPLPWNEAIPAAS